MSLLFTRSLPRFRRCHPSMMTCSMLIMTRVKFLKVADGTRIENFYDLEPNYSDIQDKKKGAKTEREKMFDLKNAIKQTLAGYPLLTSSMTHFL